MTASIIKKYLITWQDSVEFQPLTHLWSS